MFYSETLLSKTGPLARVWLAANLERKVQKKDVLQSNIESSVHAIVDQGQAPLALRLSGQLLLGVVRIYSRKARYLLDDCNEAILKIKMAFRPGNVDLPANQSHTVNPASLTLPDVLTELDLLAPIPDASLLLDDPLDDFSNSQNLLGSIERSRANSLDVAGLDTTFGEFGTPRTGRERSIEAGRNAPAPRPLAEEYDDTTLKPGEGEDLDLDLDFDEPPQTADQDTTIQPELNAPDMQDDFQMGGLDEEPMLPPDPDPSELVLEAERPRRGESPLSSIGSSAERELEQAVNNNNNMNTSLFEAQTELEEESVHQQQRVKRRKVLQSDFETELHSTQIRALQEDRSKILRPQSFLPKDPMLLALMNMQKNGGFVSSILGDGRSRGWAPELRGILSLEVIRQSGNKRKRNGLAPSSQDEAQLPTAEQPQLEFDEEDAAVNPSIRDATPSSLGMEQPAIEFEREQSQVEEGLAPIDDSDMPNQTFGFDKTEMPLLHPDESGPVSVGTKHAVHLLRDQFGNEAEASPGRRQTSSILFQDLLPERTTTRADATKMFFEVLVLATKDAIKVEQAVDQLGGPLRVRARRGLWGSWAEASAGGEIEEEGEEVVTA